MPEIIKRVTKGILRQYRKVPLFQEIAYQVADAFFGEDVDADSLKKIVYDTLALRLPCRRGRTKHLLSGIVPWSYSRLQGCRCSVSWPVCCNTSYARKGKEEVNVLVATSGDTGSAVANGFLGVEGIHVYVLYPKGKVSKIQESQFTTLGQNITALEVDGVFDDCQALVKSSLHG